MAVSGWSPMRNWIRVVALTVGVIWLLSAQMRLHFVVDTIRNPNRTFQDFRELVACITEVIGGMYIISLWWKPMRSISRDEIYMLLLLHATLLNNPRHADPV